METQIDCYLDIISPYCYLAHTQLPALARRHQATVKYHPMHIATAKIAAGNYGPSNLEVPAKAKALLRDIERWAERYGVPLKFPKGIAGETWNTGILFAQAEGKAEAYLNEAFDRLWAHGGNPADVTTLREAAAAAGLDADGFMSYIDSAQGRSAFRQACVEAHRSGVFGAPIMIVNGELFWGNDRLDFLEESLTSLASGQKTLSTPENPS